jgi:16S rRNA (uracil1498-N3)-methyltransferase
MASKVRLFVDHPLGQGQSVPVDRDQAHYLFGVMRLGPGTVLSLINGRDGEWDAEVAEAGKKGGVLRCVAQTAPLVMPPDLWLLFAPIRKDRMAFVVEKATELGARRIVPVETAFTNHADRVRPEKMQAQAREATEQCGATYMPEVAAPRRLKDVLADWPAGRLLFLCDEGARGAAAGFAAADAGPAAILIGPEGGFSTDERALLTGLPYVRRVSLGPRILRAETAAVAALVLWQRELGDWHGDGA